MESLKMQIIYIIIIIAHIYNAPNTTFLGAEHISKYKSYLIALAVIVENNCCSL